MVRTFLGYLRTELVEMVAPPALIPASISLGHRHNMSDSLQTIASSIVGQPPKFYSHHMGAS